MPQSPTGWRRSGWRTRTISGSGRAAPRDSSTRISPGRSVLDDSNAPFYNWFVGAKTNIVHNAIDRHLKTHRKNKLALIWVSETGEERTYSYFSLNRVVCQFANVLKSMGVRKGDIVTIYLPRIPELMIAMLACAKIGAAHSVVYGGFSVESLAARIEDAQSRVLITADGGFLRGKVIELKAIADEAMARQPTIETCIVVKRTGQTVPMESGRDYWLHDLTALPVASPVCATEQMDSEDMLFILYTSGTTGKPKGIVHTHGGYMVHTYDHRQVCLRPQGRRSLVVRRGPGLGNRPQLHRVLAADRRRHELYVRGRAHLPLPEPLVADGGALRDHRLLHGADGDSRPDALWRGLGHAPRPEQPAAARLGRRAHQPRGVEMVSHGDRPAGLPDHGHLVADGDRRFHDLPAAHHAAQARLGHASLFRDRGRRRRRARQARQGQRRRLPRHQDALAGDAAHPAQGSGPVHPAVLEQVRHCTRPAIRRARTTTATSGSSGAWTTSSRSAATASARPKWRAPWSATRPSPKPRPSGCRTKSRATRSMPM